MLSEAAEPSPGAATEMAAFRWVDEVPPLPVPLDLHVGVIKEAQFIFKGIVNFVFPWKWFWLKISEDYKLLWLEGNGVAWGFPLPWHMQVVPMC